MTKHDYGYVLRNFDCEITHLAQGLTDPVGMSHAELAAFYQSIRERNDYGRRFYLTMAMRPPYTPFSHKVEDFLPVDGNLNDAQYFALIHPDYLEDYLNWSSAIYRFVYQYKDLLAPFRQCFALTFPMRLKGGRFYWVHMEVVLLQLDAANRVYSHFNSYTIGQPFDGSQGILPLHGEIWEDGTMHAEWSLELRKIRFTRQPFLLCQAQRRIVDAMRADARATNKAIATQLGKSPHTINNQKKEILRKARQSFPDYTLGDTRDLLVLLEHLRYFDDYADFE